MTDPQARSQTHGVGVAVAVGTGRVEDGADAAFFRQVFVNEFRYVCTSLRRLGVPPSDIEDVAHDSFVAVYRHRHDYDPARPLRPWLFGIVFRAASAYRRRAHHRREEIVDTVPEERCPAPSADECIEAYEAGEQIRQALERIEIGRRAVLVMHELDGHAIPEIAEALSIPLNTAYSRLRLARAEFREALQRIHKTQRTP